MFTHVLLLACNRVEFTPLLVLRVVSYFMPRIYFLPVVLSFNYVVLVLCLTRDFVGSFLEIGILFYLFFTLFITYVLLQL